MNDKILITGATGHFGKAAIDFLLQKGTPANGITALVRDEAKAEDLKNKGVTLKKGDYDDYSSLVESFRGIDKLLFVSGNDISNREKQHQNVVEAALKAGVRYIIYTSADQQSEDIEKSPIAGIFKQHIGTEKMIKESGLRYTIMKNGLYADVLPMFLGDKVLETGIFLPAGEGRAAYAVRKDMAEAAANLALDAGDENREFVIAGEENYSMQEVGDILGQITGKAIAYVSPSANDYIETLTKAGVPTEFAGIIAGFAAAIEQGVFEVEKSDLEKILGRKPTSLKDYLKSVYAPKN